jgi:hypothetical protein
MSESATLLTPDNTDSVVDAAMAKLQADTPTEPVKVEPEIKEDQVIETQIEEAETKETPEPKAEEETPAPKYKVKVRGEEREVQLDELLNGYSRTEDYKAKTAELADQRRAIEAEKAKQQSEYLAAVQKSVQIAEKFDPVISEGNKTDWASLAQQDPTAYVQKRAAYEARVNEVNHLVQEQGRVQQEQFNALLVEQNRALSEKLPEWSTDEGKQKINKTVSTFLQKEGFNNDEIKQLIDHRVLMLALKAAKYDELEEAKKTVGDKKVPPVVPKTAKPTASQQGTNKDQKVVALKKQALKSGKPEDAVNAIMAALNQR